MFKPTRMTTEQIDKEITRWKAKLRRALNRLDDLDRMRKIVNGTIKPRTKARPVTMIAIAAPEKPVPAVETDHLPEPAFVKLAADKKEGIPDFLLRTQEEAEAKDAAAREAIKAELAERTKAKAAGRIAKMKAKQSGETRKMPLTGKAALDAIRNG